ncbi:hypothetical protein ACQPVP_15420 [Clostridium nigeriense]|uniref:hypothetical protein n=1 Tax=Clostridium nigeriense TaxID=1805470 RepID=UPI003D324B0B
MDRQRKIEILKQEKITLELLAGVTTDDKRKKELKERVQAYEFALNEIECTQPKVRINEFLDRNKNWVINVLVNDELIANENIEFISNRPNKDVRVVELLIKEEAGNTNSNKFLTKQEKLILSMKKGIKKLSRELGVLIHE